MITYLLLAFISLPFIEIYLLIAVGKQIGLLPTLALIILAALVGVAMLRSQSTTLLKHCQAQVQRGEVPAQAMLEALLLLIGGVLLITPGFITDVLGFLCLLPWSRRWLIAYFSSRVILSSAISPAPHHTPPPHAATLEGEYKREPD